MAKGYATLILLAFSLVGLLLLTFVIEVGKIFILKAQVTQAAEAGANAASFTFGEVLTKKITEEGEKEVAIIEQEAKAAATKVAQKIVAENGAEFVPPLEYSNTEEKFMVKVTAKKRYEPFFERLLKEGFDLVKSAQSQVRIKKFS